MWLPDRGGEGAESVPCPAGYGVVVLVGGDIGVMLWAPDLACQISRSHLPMTHLPVPHYEVVVLVCSSIGATLWAFSILLLVPDPFAHE